MQGYLYGRPTPLKIENGHVVAVEAAGEPLAGAKPALRPSLPRGYRCAMMILNAPSRRTSETPEKSAFNVCS